VQKAIVCRRLLEFVQTIFFLLQVETLSNKESLLQTLVQKQRIIKTLQKTFSLTMQNVLL
jgi:hypothetical protein